MTTVNETKVKINGSWVSLVPYATTSNKGIVQVGSGLSVSNGVISVSGGGSTVNIPHIATTNNSGFAIGRRTGTLAAISQDQQNLHDASDWTDVFTDIAPASAMTTTMYSPFSFTAPTIPVPVSVKVSSTGGNCTINFRIINSTTQEVYAQDSLTATSYVTETFSKTLELPSTWTSTDTIDLQYTAQKESEVSVAPKIEIELTAAGGAVDTTYYYNPTA